MYSCKFRVFIVSDDHTFLRAREVLFLMYVVEISGDFEPNRPSDFSEPYISATMSHNFGRKTKRCALALIATYQIFKVIYQT